MVKGAPRLTTTKDNVLAEQRGKDMKLERGDYNFLRWHHYWLDCLFPRAHVCMYSPNFEKSPSVDDLLLKSTYPPKGPLSSSPHFCCERALALFLVYMFLLLSLHLKKGQGAGSCSTLLSSAVLNNTQGRRRWCPTAFVPTKRVPLCSV